MADSAWFMPQERLWPLRASRARPFPGRVPSAWWRPSFPVSRSARGRRPRAFSEPRLCGAAASVGAALAVGFFKAVVINPSFRVVRRVGGTCVSAGAFSGLCELGDLGCVPDLQLAYGIPLLGKLDVGVTVVHVARLPEGVSPSVRDALPASRRQALAACSPCAGGHGSGYGGAANAEAPRPMPA